MTLDELLIVALVGLVAGFAASHLVSGHGYGLVGDLLIGLIGALIGTVILGNLITTYLLVPLGVAAASVLGRIVIAFIGAALLLAVLRLLSGSRVGRRRFR